MFLKRYWIGMMVSLVVSGVSAQKPLPQGAWYGHLLREDGNVISFHFDIKTEKEKTVVYIINAGEKIKVDKVKNTKDSVVIEMPVFESVFRVKKITDRKWEGSWTKAGAKKNQVMPFTAEPQPDGQPQTIQPAITDITGKWSVTFTENEALYKPGIGEWQQKGNTLRGTILTPTGDYRYLTGVVTGDSLKLSTFDGAHAFSFIAKIESGQKISGGMFYSGATSAQPWIAEKNENASLPDVAAMFMKDPEEKLRFRFLDLNKKMVSIDDAKFRNKVVIVQIMGSWCPNCMDETAFLSNFYTKYKHKGVEVIGLAYEYSTDFERAKKSIEKFKNRFTIQYTLLNTGVTSSDSLRTEKTLPQLTPIKSFPSMIIVDRTGRVAKIHTGFEGPGTGLHYEAFKKEFEAMIEALLK
jgi:thiol-disulfide isomerase/thioredoxin